MLFGQSGNIWSVLHVWGLWVAEFCGNSAAIPRRTSVFVSKSPFFGLKNLNSKKADFGRKPYVNISGFQRQFCGRFSKVKSISQRSGLHFSAFSARIQGFAGRFPLNSDKLACSCRLVNLWCFHTHPTTENNPNCVFWSELMRICGRCVFFCPFDGRPLFGWVVIGWVLGRSFKHRRN